MVSKKKEELYEINESFKREIESIKIKIKEMRELNEINEEATKTALIMPLFKALGYDVFNSFEFIPEYTADFGIKKGEKVDYAIKDEDKITIIVECKTLGTKLNKAIAQLFRYFSVTTGVSIGILTDGAKYMFFSDLDNKNIMDKNPFLEINIERANNKELTKLYSFSKEEFSPETMRKKLINDLVVKQLSASIIEEFRNPSKELIEIIKRNILMDVVKDYDEEDLKIKIDEGFSNLMGISRAKLIDILECYEGNKKIEDYYSKSAKNKEKIDIPKKKKINLQRDIDSESTFDVIKDIFKENKSIAIEDLQCKEFNRSSTIFYGGGRKKWICRFIFSNNKAIMQIVKEDNSLSRYDIKTLKEIYKYRSDLNRALVKVL